MSTHGPGKAKRYISTTIPSDLYVELQRRQVAGGWRSVGAYARAVLEHHVWQGQTLAEHRTIYPISDSTPARVAESRPDQEDHPRPLAPGCCPLARAVAEGETVNKGNGQGDR